jgi:hypothetical protein
VFDSPVTGKTGGGACCTDDGIAGVDDDVGNAGDGMVGVLGMVMPVERVGLMSSIGLMLLAAPRSIPEPVVLNGVADDVCTGVPNPGFP